MNDTHEPRTFCDAVLGWVGPLHVCDFGPQGARFLAAGPGPAAAILSQAF